MSTTQTACAHLPHPTNVSEGCQGLPNRSDGRAGSFISVRACLLGPAIFQFANEADVIGNTRFFNQEGDLGESQTAEDRRKSVRKVKGTARQGLLISSTREGCRGSTTTCEQLRWFLQDRSWLSATTSQPGPLLAPPTSVSVLAWALPLKV